MIAMVNAQVGQIVRNDEGRFGPYRVVAKEWTQGGVDFVLVDEDGDETKVWIDAREGDEVEVVADFD